MQLADSGLSDDPRDPQEEHNAPDAKHIADKDALDPSKFITNNRLDIIHP